MCVSEMSHSTECPGTVKEAKIVVGLDFGTTFSGFAYALRADPDTIYTFYDWPMQAASGGLPYCKTQTSLLYADAVSNASVDPFELRDWGWPAFFKYKSRSASVIDSVRAASGSDLTVIHDLDVHSLSEISKSKVAAGHRRSSGVGYFLTLFKLHLACNEDTFMSSKNDSESGATLPPGNTAKRAIADYLSRISKFILRELRNKFGTHITLDDVQWCLSVPAIWNEQAKQEIRHCTEIAELVRGPNSKEAGSPHPLKLFIEPEAASVYCQLKLKDHVWNKGDKFLVVDCGGGTVDLVLHEKMASSPSISVREVQESTGGLCGGSQVDEEFLSFLRRKIYCFKRFEREYPAIALDFRRGWERVKYEFDGTENSGVRIDLPPKLAIMWEEEQSSKMLRRSSTSSLISYDELELSNQDMKSIFDPTINSILELVESRVVSDLKAIVVVGGFSSSPYLMRRMKNSFGSKVANIVSPPCPGSAVCCGAVIMGIRSETIVSRISKRTYGIDLSIPFIVGVHPEDSKNCHSGKFYCDTSFVKYVSKGDEIRMNDCVRKECAPITQSQKTIRITLYSSGSCHDPKYVTDTSMKKEGSFEIECPSYNDLGFKPIVEVSMFFGRTEIQVTAVGKNFDSEKKEMLPVKFERTSIY